MAVLEARSSGKMLNTCTNHFSICVREIKSLQQMDQEEFKNIFRELSPRAQLPQRLHAHAKRLMNQALILTSWPCSSERTKKLPNQ